MHVFDVTQDQAVFHFVGIGGIGMSALADVLHDLGYKVQGSDASDNANVQRLQKKGVKTFKGHDAHNVSGATIIVLSTAIKDDNPEYVYARENGIKIVHRSEVLAELVKVHKSIAITGTHGKTTTTAMTWTALQHGGKNPGVINGGVLAELQTNAKLGDDLLVVEADESDGSFTRLHPYVVVINNIDPEHMDHFGGMEAVLASYHQFIKNTPEDGLAVFNFDHPQSRQLAQETNNREVLTYSIEDASADVFASNLVSENAQVSFDLFVKGAGYGLVTVNMPGKHNVSNALAAIAVAHYFDADIEGVKKGLAQFQGVGRRFNHVATVNNYRIIDDYAHHPVEIKACLSAAKETYKGKLIALLQVHRYTRMHDLMDDFALSTQVADFTCVVPVYPAGESPIEGATHTNLVAKMDNTKAAPVTNVEDAAKLIRQTAPEGAMVVCLGAGDITQWARDIVSYLEG